MEKFSKNLLSVLKYWTTNSYILCAMYGENLFETISQARDPQFVGRTNRTVGPYQGSSVVNYLMTLVS